MKIGELVAILLKSDQDLRVFVDGQEDGICDLFADHIREVCFVEDQTNRSWGGTHKEDKESEEVGLVLGR